MKKIVLILLLLISLTACGSSERLSRSSSSPEVGSAETSDDEAQTSPFALEGPEKDLLRSRYQFDVIFNYAQQRIAVLEKINYSNNSNNSLEEILLVIDAQQQGAEFVMEELYWVGGQSIEAIPISEGLLRIALQEALNPGENITLKVRYQLALPELAGPLGYGTRQSNFADWYPFIPPYTEKSGWLIHPATEVGEHLVYESADFDVRIQVINAPEEIQVAAPAPATKDGNTLIYKLERARRFAWSASEHYELIQGEVMGIPLMAYVFPEHLEAGLAALETSAEALETYQLLFGPFPYESLSIVEAQFPDGLESDGIFFLSQSFFDTFAGGKQNYLTTLSAHEVAHNWWFGLVGNDPALEPWLDEALATYSELLYYENTQPDLADWWWLFRILDYSPSGAVDGSIYDFESFAPYVNAVYFRGALFLEKVRTEIGDEAFHALLQNYIQAGEWRLLSGEDFLELVDSGEQNGLDELLDEYFTK